MSPLYYKPSVNTSACVHVSPITVADSSVLVLPQVSARIDAVTAGLWLDHSRSKCLYISIDRSVRVRTLTPTLGLGLTLQPDSIYWILLFLCSLRYRHESTLWPQGSGPRTSYPVPKEVLYIRTWIDANLHDEFDCCAHETTNTYVHVYTHIGLTRGLWPKDLVSRAEGVITLYTYIHISG